VKGSDDNSGQRNLPIPTDASSLSADHRRPNAAAERLRFLCRLSQSRLVVALHPSAVVTTTLAEVEVWYGTASRACIRHGRCQVYDGTATRGHQQHGPPSDLDPVRPMSIRRSSHIDHLYLNVRLDPGMIAPVNVSRGDSGSSVEGGVTSARTHGRPSTTAFLSDTMCRWSTQG
jgi:hypothetical protein